MMKEKKMQFCKAAIGLVCSLMIGSAVAAGSDAEKLADFDELDAYFLMQESDPTRLTGDLDITEKARAEKSICKAVQFFKNSIEFFIKLCPVFGCDAL